MHQFRYKEYNFLFTFNMFMSCSSSFFRKADKLKEKIQINKDLLSDNETWLTQQQLQVSLLKLQISYFLIKTSYRF